MKCVVCNQKAFFKCACNGVYLCQNDLTNHVISPGNHPIENLIVKLEAHKLEKLRSDAHDKLKELDKVKKDISTKASNLLKLIKVEHKKAIKQLDEYIETLLYFISENTFQKSDLPNIERIGLGKYEKKKFCMNVFTNEAQIFYSIDLPNFLEIKKSQLDLNQFKLMDLSQKIEFIHPLIWINCGLKWKNKDNCFKKIKDLCISEDERYLFVHSGYSNYFLEIWDMETKEYIAEWCLNTFSSCYDYENLKKWAKQYRTEVTPTYILKEDFFRVDFEHLRSIIFY